MEKALEILKEILHDLKNAKDLNETNAYVLEQIKIYEEAIADLEAFKQECEKLVIESQKLANETLDLGEIIAKQKQRIEELEATQGTRREWYQKGYNEAMNGRTCEWYYNEFDEAWDGKCGIKFVIAFDTPKGNNMNFCPCCGGKLIEIEPKDNA